MNTGFSVNVEEKFDIPTVRVRGEVDIYTCPELRQTLTATVDQGHRRFILNLEETQYIDSTGLGTIAHIAQNVDADSGYIYIVCTKPQIKKIFEVSGLPQKNIDLVETEELAIDRLRDGNG